MQGAEKKSSPDAKVISGGHPMPAGSRTNTGAHRRPLMLNPCSAQAARAPASLRGLEQSAAHKTPSSELADDLVLESSNIAHNDLDWPFARSPPGARYNVRHRSVAEGAIDTRGYG